MGAGQSKTNAGATGAAAGSSPPPCAAGAAAWTPDAASGTPSTSAPSSAPCPVVSTPHTLGQYNVYNQRIDGTGAKVVDKSEEGALARLLTLGWRTSKLDDKNNMPLEANQQPAAGQRKPISTQREASSIPKSGTGTTWTYPSPQMFFNALVRKGKADDVDEDDMDDVVFVHNGMNEATWDLVKRWELLHADECPEPKLLRFRGRPHDLSPLARARSLVTGEVPFDRHDWYIDRNGREVRYVIDFYWDEAKAAADTMQGFEVQARPALDSAQAALDRLKMNVYVQCERWGMPCPISGHQTDGKKYTRPE